MFHTLIAGLAVACYAPAHPGPVTTVRTHTLPSDVVMTVRTTTCRPVRHGDTTGVHVEVVR